jgi:hypothetical protein
MSVALGGSTMATAPGIAGAANHLAKKRTVAVRHVWPA